MNITSTNKEVLFIAGTHGDEPIGLAMLKKLSAQSKLASLFKSVIGNPQAVAKNKRFTEIDLNRVAPGDENSSVYEIRRASEIVGLFNKFNYVIDFHETKANDRIVIIIPKLSRKSLALALAFNIDEVLIWPPSSPISTKGPLAQYASSGIEIECGTKSSFELTLTNLEKIVTQFLKDGVLRVDDNLSLPLTNLEKRKFYLVYDQIKPSEIEGVDLKDHDEIKNGKEKFTALLFGKYKGLIGYKMRSLDNREIFNMISFGCEP